jgi:hypothetical protein
MGGWGRWADDDGMELSMSAEGREDFVSSLAGAGGGQGDIRVGHCPL